MFLHVVWIQCLFRVGDLICLAWRTRFGHFVDVMIDTTHEACIYLHLGVHNGYVLVLRRVGTLARLCVDLSSSTLSSS